MRTSLGHRSRAPARSRAWPGIAAAAIAVVLGLVGCSPSPTAAPSAAPVPTLPAGVTVELAQLRADVAPRQAQLRVINGSDTAITVGEVRVEDPRLHGPATRVVPDRVSTIPARGSVDIRVQLPPVACSAPDKGDSEAVLELVGESESAEVTAPAPDTLGFLAPLHSRECLQERMADAATLAFTDFQPSAPGEPATLELTVTPTGAGAGTVVGLERTNLLDFAGAPAEDEVFHLDIDVSAAEAEPVVVEVPLVPFRCDPHAVQEDKRGTIFDVRIELEGEPGEFELFVGDELRGRILTWVAGWCGFAG
ncbi:hypothetical protein Q9R08_15330 [Microbacterium sp. QXD-8]|uniref:Abnormal spindle-like microcephaly-associated protein ASH domain-containing protein n=1 Tax=Microbacterium psychrotolerans TaxID=3068321 RepID=A0ABU0Z497_9MICO|nr:hypothetical protein [Microbacterium sp. QXD-8]MDQ7879362.1 hypothetical protein [Microbacterium sp. QXD-8]